MDVGLQWLGLSRDESRVFQAVIELQEISQKDLAALLLSSAPVISKTVGRLRQRGLVQTSGNRRPLMVFLSPTAPAVVQRLKERAEDQADAIAGSLAELEDMVADAARMSEERGRPFYERSSRLAYLWDQKTIGAHGHDEVHILGKPYRVGRYGRLLTTTQHDLEEALHGQTPGTEIRRSTESLPRLKILDRERVSIEASAADGVRTFWSHDARHVRAASELFELWWERAGPGVVKTVDRSEVPVDEWMTGTTSRRATRCRFRTRTVLVDRDGLSRAAGGPSLSGCPYSTCFDATAVWKVRTARSLRRAGTESDWGRAAGLVSGDCRG